VKRLIARIILVILIILVTFFGLGPVMFADGTMRERVFTFLVVLALYVILGFLFNRTKKIKG